MVRTRMKLRHRILGPVAALAALALPCLSPAQTAPDYQIVKKIPLGAPDRWDYVVFDESSDRVFVAHGEEITVVEGTSGDIAGHIKSFPGITHGIAIVTASNRGYTD